MASRNDKYRNPPCPVDYTMSNKPCLQIKEPFDLSKYIINSGILDVPDLSIFDNLFIISSSEEEENEIDEVPVNEKAFELVNLIEESQTPLSKDITAVIEKESPDTPSETSEDLVHCHKAAASPSKEQRSEEDSEGNKKKKKKKVKREKRYSSSSRESDSRKRRKKRARSRHTPSPSSSRRRTSSPSLSPCSSKAHDQTSRKKWVQVKEEIGGDGLLYGVYHCHVCSITMNSLPTYTSHMTGKRHQKAVNAQNVVDYVAKTFVPTEAVSKYPKPPPGYYRVRYSGPAKIQAYIDENLNIPSPGLDYVTEIQGITETSYYCSLCDSHCSANSILPHLTGFKHQLSSLKHFKRELYEKLYPKQKYQIERQVLDELRKLQRYYGRGLIKVEKDYLDDGFPKDEKRVHKDLRRQLDKPSTSQETSGLETENYALYSVPDRSKSGFYCKLCDSHSNNFSMWQSHIIGKRHLTNLKKAPGTAPSKNKYVPAGRNARSCLMKKLENVKGPVVGLSQIREIHKPEVDGVTFTCFLCCSCVAKMDIVEHVLSRKHREKYLANIHHSEFETLKCFDMKESAVNSLIVEFCEKEEAEKGRGRPEVYFSKNAVRKG